MKPINTYLLKLSKRAESYDKKHLIESFVDVGPLFTLLSNRDSQILFGRRGTGKTHVFSYLVSEMSNKGAVALHLDMRTIGSTGGIYSDNNLPLQERATRLLVDTLCAIHDGILSEIIEKDDEFDLSKIGPLLDKFATVSTQVIVEGPILIEKSTDSSFSCSNTSDAGIRFTQKNISGSLSISDKHSSHEREQQKTKREGSEKFRVHFGSVGNELQNLITGFGDKELWLILDEWSEIPLDIQPYLADLLRRTVFPTKGISVKIAAIEQRCNFRIPDKEIGHIGIEVGADIAASISLDEFLIFDNNPEQAKEFFSNLIFKHVKAISESDPTLGKYTTASQIINEIFTQRLAFDEFVKASEGVPRDAINIIGLAAQRALANNISIQHIRIASRNWYTRAKQKAVSTRPHAQKLLNWIIDKVIQHRQAKAFLIEVDTQDELIDFLHDARVLHLIKEGISAQDYPGIRFNAFSLDYGCYVDLINTSRAPKGLFEVETEEGEQFAEVPQTDFRAIRRAILDLKQFYDATL